MEQSIALANLQALDRSIIVCDQLDGLRLVEDVTVRELSDLAEEVLDDCVPASLWEYEVLLRVEFEQDVWFIMVDKLDALLFEVTG